LGSLIHFVQAPAAHPATLRFALALVVAACAALGVFAAPASAEAIEGMPAAPATGESSLPTEAEAPAPTEAAPIPDVPQIEEVTEAATETVDATEAAAATDSVEAAVESTSASSPSPEVSVPTPPPPDVPTADLSDAVRTTDPTPSVPRTPRLAVADDAVTAPVKQLPDVEVPRRDAISLVTPTTSAIKEVRPATPGTSPGSAQRPSAGGAPHFSMPLPTGASSLDRDADAPLSPLAKYSGEPGGFEAPSLATANGRYLEGLASSTVASAARGGSDPAGHLNDPAPLDGPVPLPGAPAAAVSSSGDAFFVPIAALLALLALVAPAIFRRLREVPNFPAPTPFVCALERPG
jgi:hypothetical protein